MTATMRSMTPPELGTGGRRLVIDCAHGTTFVDLYVAPSGGPVGLSERALIAVAVERHEAEEGCGCARGLDTLVRVKGGALA